MKELALFIGAALVAYYVFSGRKNSEGFDTQAREKLLDRADRVIWFARKVKSNIDNLDATVTKQNTELPQLPDRIKTWFT